MTKVRAKFECIGILDNPEYKQKTVNFTPVINDCGSKHDRDINASINIKRFALNKITIGQDMPEFTLVENEQ